jgi:transcriptional regulator with XRE-family HTH domain
MTGNEFRAIREHLGLSREEMAELLGLSGYTAVSNIELGHRNPSKLTAMLLRALKSLSPKRAKELIELLRGFRK